MSVRSLHCSEKGSSGYLRYAGILLFFVPFSFPPVYKRHLKKCLIFDVWYGIVFVYRFLIV